MSLGNLMEPWFADRYATLTGRTLSAPSSFAHSEFPELRVNIDRLIGECEGHDGPGVLEIKSQGRAAYYRSKREGLSADYILQVQWALMVTGLSWGAFAIGCRDTGELMHWDFTRDQTIIAEMLEAGPALWALIKSDDPLPPVLECSDKRCQSCQYRQSCHGGSLLPNTEGELPYAEDLRPLLAEYDRVNAAFTETLADGSRGTIDQLHMEEVRELIRNALGSRDAVAIAQPDAKDRRIYFRSQEGRLTWKMEPLLKAYEALRTMLRDGGGTTDHMDKAFPPAKEFERRGVPFRSLRLF